MKRSALSLGLLYAACGFAVTGVVLLAPPLQADRVEAVTPKTSISTKTFDLAVRFNVEANAPEVFATNTTDQPQKVEWTTKLRSSGTISPFARSMPQMKDVSSEPSELVLAPHESKAVAMHLPEPKGNEMRQAVVVVGEESLDVPLPAVKIDTAAIKAESAPALQLVQTQ